MRAILKRILLFSFIFGGIVGIYAYSVIIPKEIEKKLTQSLQKIGFKKVTYKSVSYKSDSFTFHDISLDPKSFSGIEEISIEYSLWSFFTNNRQAKRIKIKNLQLTGDITEDLKFKIAGWKNNLNLAKTIVNLPTRALIFENTKVEFLAPELGGLNIIFNGQMRRNDTGAFSISGSASTQQKKLELEARILGNLNADGTISIDAASENVEVDTNNFIVRRANVTAKYIIFSGNEPPTLEIDGNASSLVWFGLPFRDMHLSLENKNKTLQLFVDGHTAGSHDIEFSSQFHFDQENMNFEGNIYPEKVEDLENYLKAASLLPPEQNFPEILSSKQLPIIAIEGKKNFKTKVTQGTIGLSNAESNYELNTSFLYADSKLSGKIDLPKSTFSNTTPLENLGANKKSTDDKITLAGDGTFEIDYTQTPPKNILFNFKGNYERDRFLLGTLALLNLNGAFQLSSDTSQNMQRPLDFYLPLAPEMNAHKGQINIDWNAPKAPIIGAKLSIYDGSIYTQDITFPENNRAKPNTITLQLGGIDFSKFLLALRFKGLFGTGTIGGQLPIHIKDNTISIRKGILQSESSGTIQIPLEYAQKFIPQLDQEQEDLWRSLENFHFEFFEIRIDGNLDELLTLNVIAKGYNPDYDTKQSLKEIKFTITENIPPLFKYVIQR